MVPVFEIVCRSRLRSRVCMRSCRNIIKGELVVDLRDIGLDIWDVNWADEPCQFGFIYSWRFCLGMMFLPLLPLVCFADGLIQIASRACFSWEKWEAVNWCITHRALSHSGSISLMECGRKSNKMFTFRKGSVVYQSTLFIQTTSFVGNWSAHTATVAEWTLGVMSLMWQRDVVRVQMSLS